MLSNSIGKQKFNIKGIKLLPLKPVKSSHFSKKLFKKKIFYKKKLKKNFNFIKKKKKLSLVYKIFSLNNQSFFYKLRRKILKNFLKFKEQQNILKLKLKLKQLYFLNNSDIFSYKALLKKKEMKVSALDSTSLDSQILLLKKKVKFFLSITIHSNNIFMNLSKYLKKNFFKTVKFWSAGMFDFICSKTKLKFGISAMLKEVKIQLKQLKIYTIKIKAPKYLNKYIFKQLSRLLYKPKFFIYSSFKIFNGCRSQKKRRKKRLKFRFFR